MGHVLAAADPVSSAYDTLIKQGPLGAVCVLLIIALAFVTKGLLKSKDDRLVDQKSSADAIKSLNEASKNLAVEIKENMYTLTSDVTRSNDRVTSRLESMEKEHREVRMTLEKLRDSHREQEISLASLKESLKR